MCRRKGEGVNAWAHDFSLCADLHADLNLNVSVKAVFVLNIQQQQQTLSRILFLFIFSHTLHIVCGVCVRAQSISNAAAVGDLICGARFSLEKDGWKCHESAAFVRIVPCVVLIQAFGKRQQQTFWCKMRARCSFCLWKCAALEKSQATTAFFNCKCFSLLLLFSLHARLGNICGRLSCNWRCIYICTLCATGWLWLWS